MLKNFYGYVCRIESLVARSALVLMIVLIFTAAVMRSLGHPINWAVDAATFLFAWCCFLSADVAWREGKLITVDTLVNRLPKRAARWLRVFNYSVIAVFLVYLVGFGLWLSHTTRARTFQGIPGFSYTWVTLSVPVGAILLLITTVLKIRGELAKKETTPPL